MPTRYTMDEADKVQQDAEDMFNEVHKLVESWIEADLGDAKLIAIVLLEMASNVMITDKDVFTKNQTINQYMASLDRSLARLGYKTRLAIHELKPKPMN